LGWPEQTEDLKTFYPTSALITSYDIIFFWVARMIMLGMKFMGDVPFRTVYFNSLVRDAEGQKMSKSKGNVIDPVEVMEQYGTDAVRFTLAIMAAPGTDISLSQQKMLSYRAFANKIWNATRFVLLHLEDRQVHIQREFDVRAARDRFLNGKSGLSPIDRWILSRLNSVIHETNESLEAFRFHEASHRLYHFFWHELCDWYIEFIKPQMVGSEAPETSSLSFEVLIFVFNQALKLLHPFMPFITEELWQRLPHQGVSISIQDFPEHQPEFIDAAVEQQIEILEEVITKIRNLRAEIDIEPAKRILVNLASPDESLRGLLDRSAYYIKNLARCEQIEVLPSIARGNHSYRDVTSGIEVEIPLAGLIDVDAERLRIRKEISKIEKEMTPIQQKLLNADFLAHAPQHVVKLNQTRLVEFQEKLHKLSENLKRL
jgi:valyl-tRNA synthetase